MKLALGTVQFGVDYGVSNTQGKPSTQEVHNILQLAAEKQIVTLDSAIGYGDSHSAISSFNELHNYFSIITKIPPFQAKQFDSHSQQQYVEYIDQCFSELKCSHLNAILFHQVADIFKPGVEPILNYLEQLKAKHNITHTGVSLYSGVNITELVQHPSINLVQIPFNAFDNYFKKNNALTCFKDNNITVHARSVFLQGLLLMPIDKLNDYFLPWRKYLKQFHLIAKQLNVSALTLCLAYVEKEPSIDRIVVGVNSECELTEIFNAYETINTLNLLELPSLAIDAPQLTNPALWKP
ncbi:aldo/keto reductase [Marinomonas sp. 2405UD68-3]|uniref:aldo/keto reductase n=1 Tax=Marinomonas sp. 2405UD68-3 TaxID=3391835 RepID=UPI0039C96E03